jgi:hypothetical protein
MAYGLLADLVVLLHGAFVLFVVLGVLLVARWRWLLPFHLTCAAWGAYLEFTGAICPLTPLENHFRGLAGEAGYTGGFIEHYIVPVIYPPGLTERIQVILGVGVVVLNVTGYAVLWHRRRAATHPPA